MLCVSNKTGIRQTQMQVAGPAIPQYELEM